MNFDYAKLLQAMKDAEAVAPGVMLVINDLIEAFNGKAKLMASTIKCGPDGCMDPAVCIDGAIASEIQTLAALVQAKRALAGPPTPNPEPDPIPAS